MPASIPHNSLPVCRVPLLDVVRDGDLLRDEILTAVAEIYDTGRFVNGPHCQAFERAIAETCETKFAVGCASGSDALLLALMAIDTRAGDEVILPSFTFFATASAVTRLGATPVFVGIDPVTFNICPAAIEAAVTEQTKAIMPVHLFGQCADMDTIGRIAEKNSLHVIEDAAQAIGARHGDRAAGSMGDIGCFSFYPTKNLGGVGDGGILTTSNEQLADRLRLLASHGMNPRYYHSEVGINSRLDTIQAAALHIKLKRLADWTARRQQNAARYAELFVVAGLANTVTLPDASADTAHAWNQFTIRVPNGQRDALRAHLADANVGSEIYYPVPLHQQKCFASLPHVTTDLPETERASAEVLSLPIFPGLTQEEQGYVVDQTAAFFAAGQHRLAS